MEGRAPPQRGTRRRAQYKPMLVRLVTLSERGAVVIAARSVRVSRVQTRPSTIPLSPPVCASVHVGITEPPVRCVVYIHPFPTTSRTQEGRFSAERDRSSCSGR